MPALTIAVAGAGPAGLATALLLTRDGHRVVVFDQFSEPRSVGSGLILQPTGLRVLSELGLAEPILSLGSRIDRLFGRAVPSERIVLDVRYGVLGAGRSGVAVHRALLFQTLFDAVLRAGIPIETERRIAAVETGAGGRATLLDEICRREGPFDFVVDALGVWSPLWPAFGGAERRALRYGVIWSSLPWPDGGFDPHALEQRYEHASTMVGVLPVGRRAMGRQSEAAFFWSIRLDQYQAWRATGLRAWKDKVLQLWPATAPLLAAITSPDQMTLARYAHHMLRRPVAHRMAAVGDAFHAASPQLGQGANMALLDAEALAFALRSIPELEEALAAYARIRLSHMRFYQAMSAIFTPFYQSDSRWLPLLRDWVLAPATRLPLIRTFVAASVAGLVLDRGAGLR